MLPSVGGFAISSDGYFFRQSVSAEVKREIFFRKWDNFVDTEYWLVGVKRLFQTIFSLYRVVSVRDGERKQKE